MAYILENANVLREWGLEKISLLIKEGRYHSLRTSFPKLNFMKMNADGYIMTPTHTLFCPHLPVKSSFYEKKNFFMNQLVHKGSTMFLTYVEVTKEHQLKSSLQWQQKNLLSCPIDYSIAVKIPLTLLTPSFVRACKREKIPAIFIEIDETSPLESMPWGWIREALFPYNSPLVPVFKNTDKKIKSLWTSILSNEKIPFIKNELLPLEFIPPSVLCQIGIFPKKMGIRQGGEVSYNLYYKENAHTLKEIQNSHRLNPDDLRITVHKGIVIRAGDYTFFRSGFGESIRIDKPAFFDNIS